MHLTNYHNYDYIGTFYVGTPPQPLRGCFDTGSSNAWILAAGCDNKRCEPGSKNEYFKPNESSTFYNTSMFTEIQFGSGALVGYFGVDNFMVG